MIFVKNVYSETAYFLMETLSLFIWVARSLIAVKNESGLLLSLAVIKGPVSILGS